MSTIPKPQLLSPYRSSGERPNISVPTMVRIPAGRFMMGCANEWARRNEQPVREVTISQAFNIGLYPVTNQEYAEFLSAHDRTWLYSMTDKSGAKLMHPVRVSWAQALEYCEWLSAETHQQFTLPTEAQWEYACRGTDGREHPWGNDWDWNQLKFHNNFSTPWETTPVSKYPQGASCFGVMDMVGNGGEWVADWYGPYDSQELVDPRGPLNGTYKVVRGSLGDSSNAANFNHINFFTSTRRGLIIGDNKCGFRVVETLRPFPAEAQPGRS